MTNAAPATGFALQGVRVVDLSRVLAGPMAAQILGDHGADVIKIEPPQGDDTRDWGPPFVRADDGAIVSSTYYEGANRNKRALALDLTRPQARQILMRLLQHADVLIENFKSGTMERWNLGFEKHLSSLFPRLIFASVSGFGASEPLGGAPGYDAVAQAMTGLMSVNAAPGAGPLRMGVPIVDISTAMNIALGILMALQARTVNGRGRRVDVSLYESGLSLVHPQASNWLIGGREPKPMGNAHPNISPYDSFETKTGPIFLGVGNDRQFALACEMLGAPELARDARFLTNGERSENRAALRPILEKLLAAQDAHKLTADLLAAGVPAGAVESLPQALGHPHTAHLGAVVECGAYRGVASPIRISGETRGQFRPPPRFAEHTDEVLNEAGYTPAEIIALEKAGAVFRARR